MSDEFRSRNKRNIVLPRPFFQGNKVGGEQNRRELAPVAEDGGEADQRIDLKRIFSGLRGDKFSARRFDEVVLAAGDGEISIGLEVADVASLEPAIDDCRLRFLRPVP